MDEIISLWSFLPGNFIENLNEAQKEHFYNKIGGHINVKWVYNLYLKLLYWSMPSNTSEWQANSKIFLYFLYSFIQANSVFLKELREIITKSDFANYLKNSKQSWEWDYNRLLNDLDACYFRYRIYDSDLKKIFNIPIKENNISQISKNFPVFGDLTEDQVNRLLKYIIYPIFKGKFFNEPGKFLISQCSYDESYTPINCKLYSIDEYPIPLVDPNDGLSVPDAIQPIAIYNKATSMRRLGVDLWFTLQGMFNRDISFFTGINKDYIGNTAEYVDEKITDVKEWAAEKQRQFNKITEDVTSAIKNFPANLKKTSSDFATYVVVGGIVVLGLYLVSNEMRS